VCLLAVRCLLQRLPELALFPPVGDLRQWLHVPQLDRIATPLRMW
jgi:hypothetical protein